MAQELKDYDIMDIEAMDDERLEKSSTGKIFVTRVYIKDEVDAVLAEKGAEIARLKKAARQQKADQTKELAENLLGLVKALTKHLNEGKSDNNLTAEEAKEQQNG